MPQHAKALEPERSLHAFMTVNHEYLNDVFGRLLNALEVDAPDVRELWTELDHGLLAHMEAEERFVLPAFARIDRDEAFALLREHARIRKELLELGVAVDLHCIRFAQARTFIETLRVHADREDHLLYRWADDRLDAALAQATRLHVNTR